MKNKGLLLTNILLVILISACGSFPTESEYWKIDGQWPGYAQVHQDMADCKFDNFYNNARMPVNNYIISSKCMEKKGYLFNEEPICSSNAYQSKSACKN